MKNYYTITSVLIFLSLTFLAFDAPLSSLKEHLYYLASDELEGRRTGTKGEKLATEYVKNVFQSAGLIPLETDYFQEFEFTQDVSLGDNNNAALIFADKKEVLELDKDFRPISFSSNGPLNEEIVFAGYGIIAPKTDTIPEYSSYANLDVKDKWVMVFRYIPENASDELKKHLLLYSTLRHKATFAFANGATGMLVVSGPNSQVQNQLVALKVDETVDAGSLTALSITDAVADKLLGEGVLKKLQDQLDGGQQVKGFKITNVSASANVNLKFAKGVGRNVVAYLQRGKEKNPTVIIVGAHIDHLGKGNFENSYSKWADSEQIHYGADDNASGTSAVMEIAKNLAAVKTDVKFKKDIIFAAWSGEEMGLLGSDYFVKNFRKGQELYPYVSTYINLDMVGRLSEKLLIQGVGGSQMLKGLADKSAKASDLPFSFTDNPYLPTDSSSFYIGGVPVLDFFTGIHEDYHKPSDTPDKINYEGLSQITELITKIVYDLAISDEIPDYVKVDKPGSSTSFKVYIGTIPDFSAENVSGLKIRGVKPDSPAEKAGLAGGDIIIRVGKNKITNLYDYSFALSLLKVGAAVEFEVLRGNEQFTFTVVPESKD